jgi:hypothetical protein
MPESAISRPTQSVDAASATACGSGAITWIFDRWRCFETHAALTASGGRAGAR